MRPYKKKSKGSALLTSLFIMTLVAIVATAMSTRLQLDIYRTRLFVTHDKLYLVSQIVTFWAFNQLNTPSQQFTKANNQAMVAQYPKNREQIVSPIKVSGALYDLQSRFNLNNLVDKKFISVFINLLSHTVKAQKNEERIDLALAVNDWLTAYDLSRGKDNYTTYYRAQKPPYYPSHQLMASASELRLVKKVSPLIFQAIEPFITVLPESTPININTASKELLMSLGNGLNEEEVNELIMAREKEGIKSLNDISELIKKMRLPPEQLTITSQYFLCIAHASSDEFQLTIYTLLKRGRDKQGKVTLSIVKESINSPL